MRALLGAYRTRMRAPFHTFDTLRSSEPPKRAFAISPADFELETEATQLPEGLPESQCGALDAAWFLTTASSGATILGGSGLSSGTTLQSEFLKVCQDFWHGWRSAHYPLA